MRKSGRGRIGLGIAERLGPAQVRAAAEGRFVDAERLHRTGLRRHTNGTIYLAGLCVDCLLKAALLEKHPHLRHAHPDSLRGEDTVVWRLIYRSHLLDAMVARLPEVADRVAAADQAAARRGGRRTGSLRESLRSVCAGWTISTRYAPREADIEEASEFFNKVKELRSCLRRSPRRTSHASRRH